MMLLLFVLLHVSLGQDNDLLTYTCELMDDHTKQNEFYDDVVADIIGLKYYEEYFHVVYGNEQSSIGAEGQNCTSESDVTWCLHIWHPDSIIRVCLNSTWSYSNELAARYNLIDNLEYLKTCQVDHSLTQAHACLRIKTARRYYELAFITSSGPCQEYPVLYNVIYSSLDTTVYTSAPAMPVHYSYYGSTVVLTCEFVSQTTIKQSMWRNATGGSYGFVIEEDFRCNSTANDSCYIDIRPDAVAAKEQRIRQYRLIEHLDCLGGQKEHIFLVIDDLREGDGGNYTCSALATNDQEARNQIQVVPIPPVRQPSNMSVSRNETQDYVSFSCSFVAGVRARIYWDTPNGRITESTVLGNVTMIVVTNVTVMPDHFARHESMLTIQLNNTGNVYGEYKAVLVDDGNPLDKSDDVLVEHSFHLVMDNDMIPHSTPGAEKASKDKYIMVGILAAGTAITVVMAAMFAILFFHYRRHRLRVAVMAKDENFFKMSMLRKNSVDFGYVLGPKAFVNQLFLLDKDIDREVPRDCIKYEGVLGQGTFGQVVKARLASDGNTSIVAIKTIKDNASPKDVQDMRYELEMMKHVEPHPNVVNLLGYCTITDGPPCIVMEYVAHGNLKTFLHKCNQSLHYRPRIEASSTSSCSSGCTLLSHQTSSHGPLSAQESVQSTTTMHSYITFPLGSPVEALPMAPESPVFATPTTPTCEDVSLFAVKPEQSSAHRVWPIRHDYINIPGLLTDELIHNFALQIASGMEHLYNMNIIHCDLAARNILVTRDHTLKIADFGMAKDLGEKEYHRKNPKDRIPVKWTAPEVLERWIFTHKSDIWSYAVILWEILTYGEMPYKNLVNGVSIWDDMVTHLRAGHRLTPPKSSPEVILKLMSQCWAWDPQERPSAGDIVEILNNATSLNLNEKDDSGYIDEQDLEKYEESESKS